MSFKIYLSHTLFQTSIFLLGLFLQKENQHLYILNQLNWSVYISRGAGLCLAINSGIILLPVLKKTCRIVNQAIHFDLFLNDGIFFHKLYGYTLIFWSIVHAVSHFFNFVGVQEKLNINTLYNLHFNMYSSVSGYLMLVSLIIIASTTLIKKTFEFFWYYHHFFVLFYIALVFHGAGCFVKGDNGVCVPYYSYVIVLGPMIVYIIERIIREFRPLILENYHLVYYNGDTTVVKLVFDKPFEFKSGEYVLIKCLNVSKFQWHPFTISSSETDPYIEVTFICKESFDWTTNVKNLLLFDKRPVFQIDGPYSSSITNNLSGSRFIFVAGGIGITPFISVLKHFLTDPSFLENTSVDIVWVNRDYQSFEWFNKELELLYKYPEKNFRFHMYLTQKLDLRDNIMLTEIDTKFGFDINYGRPDFNKFFKSYTRNNTGVNVKVYTCCNNSILANVKNCIDKYSNKDTAFQIFNEKFTF